MGLGFTPINTPAASSSPQAEKRDNAHSTKTVVSQYLGRGDAVPEAPVPTGARKPASKGKKRAAPKNDAAKSKRRRVSSVKDGLSVAKPDGTLTEAAKQQPAKQKKKAKARRSAPQTDAVGTAGGDNAPVATKSVSLYAPAATSMDALASTSARTSFDSVKANAGQSFTLYQQNASSNNFIDAAGNPSLPLLNSSAAASQYDTAAVASQMKRPKRSSCSRPQYSSQFKAPEGFASTPAPDVRPNSHESETEDGSNFPRRSSRLTKKSRPEAPTQTGRLSDVDSEFNDVEDDDLVDFARSVDRFMGVRPAMPPPRNKSQNMREVDEYEDYGGNLLSTAEKKLLDDMMKKSNETALKPIVRKPFPSSILDRSPIWGASNSTLLRTCFRVGEAMNVGSQAVRCNENVVIELYARVTSSWREEKLRPKQHFVFRDLYHDKPPHLEGTYQLFNQAVLWDLDSKAFLRANAEGIMCRTVAKMKRERQQWRLEILNIWEATWDDVNFVAGVCTGEVAEDDNE